MTKTTWRQLLKRLDINTSMGVVTPATPEELRAFEQRCGVKLPRSYQVYCEVFGAGRLGGLFNIAVPGYKGKAETYSLACLNTMAHDGLEYEEYSKNPGQHKRGIFFAFDIIGSYHFFDPEDIADRRQHEYAVYTLFRNWKLLRVANHFSEFATECCLGEKCKRLIRGCSPEQRFEPVTV